MDLIILIEDMTMPVMILMIVLIVMSMWSVGVFFERLFYIHSSRVSSPRCLLRRWRSTSRTAS